MNLQAHNCYHQKVCCDNDPRELMFEMCSISWLLRQSYMCTSVVHLCREEHLLHVLVSEGLLHCAILKQLSERRPFFISTGSQSLTQSISHTNPALVKERHNVNLRNGFTYPLCPHSHVMCCVFPASPMSDSQSTAATIKQAVWLPKQLL